jgi:predicted dehydrogenase
MRIAIVGCGYVFDFYMSMLPSHPDLQVTGVHDIDPARTAAVAKHYGVHVYPDLAALLADSGVELVVNLTSIDAHFAVTKAALDAGKHVYCEKPLVTDLAQGRELFALADAKGLVLAAAPSNLFSDTVQSMWKAVRDGAIGAPLLAYAEFDDNPIYLMRPEKWRSASGAPWPYSHEYESGCTFEHSGYHLVWLCAILGPAVSVTGFSKMLVADKADVQLQPPDTPDFAVGCIQFASGAAARLTCSIIAPADHRMRIFGRAGEISADTYRDYQAPVRLERFSPLALSARRLRIMRRSPALGSLLGIGGVSLPLARNARSQPSRPIRSLRDFKRRQEGQQDKALGVALIADAIRNGRPSPIPPDFILHVTELTLAIQRAGTDTRTHRMETSFIGLQPLPETLAGPNYAAYAASHQPSLLARIVGRRR